jgi:hypothetical protein
LYPGCHGDPAAASLRTGLTLTAFVIFLSYNSPSVAAVPWDFNYLYDCGTSKRQIRKTPGLLQLPSGFEKVQNFYSIPTDPNRDHVPPP